MTQYWKPNYPGWMQRAPTNETTHPLETMHQGEDVQLLKVKPYDPHAQFSLDFIGKIMMGVKLSDVGGETF